MGFEHLYDHSPSGDGSGSGGTFQKTLLGITASPSTPILHTTAFWKVIRSSSVKKILGRHLAYCLLIFLYNAQPQMNIECVPVSMLCVQSSSYDDHRNRAPAIGWQLMTRWVSTRQNQEFPIHRQRPFSRNHGIRQTYSLPWGHSHILLLGLRGFLGGTFKGDTVSPVLYDKSNKVSLSHNRPLRKRDRASHLFDSI